MQRRQVILIISISIILVIMMSIYMDRENMSSYLSHEALAKIKLPNPVYNSKTSIEEALKNRRSIRQYKNEPLTLQQISQLLWAAQGITSESGLRAAPSAGALYPLEIYLVTGNVKDLLPGIYHYLPKENVLELLVKNDVRKKLATAALGQIDVEHGAVDIVITAAYGRTETKYGSRGERFVHLEAGHAAQNICLQVVSLGLATVPVGAFNDSEVKEILYLPKDEEPLYIMPVGKI